jgi:hypothetical protein
MQRHPDGLGRVLSTPRGHAQDRSAWSRHDLVIDLALLGIESNRPGRLLRGNSLDELVQAVGSKLCFAELGDHLFGGFLALPRHLSHLKVHEQAVQGRGSSRLALIP